MSVRTLGEILKGKLIVSCQGSEGDPSHHPSLMARFAEAAVAGGAAAVRANGVQDISAIRAAISAPIIGIQKTKHEDGITLITPSFAAAELLVKAGADMIALDCTKRGQQLGALERLQRIRAELGIAVLADIATIDEALAAADAGADFVLSTLRGYTAETSSLKTFEPAFIQELVGKSTVPVIAEGRILFPAQARKAIAAGAFAVIVGTAITRPRDLARSFSNAIEKEFERKTGTGCFAGIDLGGTNTKYGLLSYSGSLLHETSIPTPSGGRSALLDCLKRAATSATGWARNSGIRVSGIGIATAGCVDPSSGRVAYATGNLPGWTGTALSDEISSVIGLPVTIENDANALAVAEKYFGAAQSLTDFVCITLGTGLGAGCYIDGKLNRGAHYFANALGHIPLEAEGLPCTCGQRGCLEPYVNAAALVRYAGGKWTSAFEVIAAANAGSTVAMNAITTLSRYLARGCASVVYLLDPQALIFSGGLAENNPTLISGVQKEMASLITPWKERQLIVRSSQVGYFRGVLGAAALARDSLFA